MRDESVKKSLRVKTFVTFYAKTTSQTKNSDTNEKYWKHFTLFILRFNQWYTRRLWKIVVEKICVKTLFNNRFPIIFPIPQKWNFWLTKIKMAAWCSRRPTALPRHPRSTSCHGFWTTKTKISILGPRGPVTRTKRSGSITLTFRFSSEERLMTITGLTLLGDPPQCQRAAALTSAPQTETCWIARDRFSLTFSAWSQFATTWGRARSRPFSLQTTSSRWCRPRHFHRSNNTASKDLRSQSSISSEPKIKSTIWTS